MQSDHFKPLLQPNKSHFLGTTHLNWTVSKRVVHRKKRFQSVSCQVAREACGTFSLYAICPDYTPAFILFIYFFITSPSSLSRSHTGRSVQNSWQQHPSAEAFKCLLWWGNNSLCTWFICTVKLLKRNHAAKLSLFVKYCKRDGDP